jgi:hypothetical protein
LPTVPIGLAPLPALAPLELCDLELALFGFAAFFAAFGFDRDFGLDDFDFVLV